MPNHFLHRLNQVLLESDYDGLPDEDKFVQYPCSGCGATGNLICENCENNLCENCANIFPADHPIFKATFEHIKGYYEDRTVFCDDCYFWASSLLDS